MSGSLMTVSQLRQSRALNWVAQDVLYGELFSEVREEEECPSPTPFNS